MKGLLIGAVVLVAACSKRLDYLKTGEMVKGELENRVKRIDLNIPGPPPLDPGPRSPNYDLIAKASAKIKTLKVTDIEIGTGPVAREGKYVTLHYRGMLPDGYIFDQTTKSGGKPIRFRLGEGSVIKGWEQGILGMKVGGKRQLEIPSELAYGANPPDNALKSGIRPNTALIFIVELLFVGDRP